MSSVHLLRIALIVLLCYSTCCLAFGAGNIPNYAFLSGKAYRHGDIEEILADLFIRVFASEGGGALEFVKKAAGFGGEKFSALNVKRTYFGNWLYPPPSILS
jgi:Heterokaryon incompatibility protein Het-C